jgi:hypothetical protein
MVDARARGLASRLLDRDELAAARRAGDLAAVAQLVARRGFPLAAGHPTPATLEAAVRAGVAAELRVLGRWLDRRRRLALAVVFADEDRRSVRRVVRGLLAGLPAAERAAGALPTPSLPVGALAELARQPSVRAVATLLTVWGNPFGRALAAVLGGTAPDLLRLELALDGVVAGIAARAARRGGLAVRRLVALAADGSNAAVALLLAGGAEVPPDDCFRLGGRRLSRERFLAAAGAGSPRRAAALLAPALVGGAVGAALASGEVSGGALERALLADQLAEQRLLARTLPGSGAPTLCWLLALQQEARELRAAVWEAALGAEPGEGEPGKRRIERSEVMKAK